MMTNTASFCQILGGLRNRSFNMMQSRWKIIPTWLHGKQEVGTINPRNFSLSAQDIQGPLNQRGDFIEAKQKCKRLHDEHPAMTGDGHKPIPPKQQVRQQLDQQFEGLEKYDYRLEGRTGWRYYPSSRTTHSSSSSHWQPSSKWKSNRGWDPWQTLSGLKN